MNNAKKSEEKKAAVQKTVTPAENKNAVKEAAAEIKAETKSPAAAKATAKKTAAPKTEKAAKKPAAKAAAKKADTKTAKATKPAAKATVKPAAKSADKTTKTTKTGAAAKKTPPAKKSAKKSNDIGTICTKLNKKISKTKAAAIKEKIAVDIEVWGFEDGSNSKMYIEINNGNVTVMPHTYEEKDFRISLSFANAVAFVEGKLTLKGLIESKDFYAEGNIVSAIKLASVF